MLRKAEGERWDAKMLTEMRGTPQQPAPTKPGSTIQTKITFDPPEEKREEEVVPLRQEKGRRFQITKRVMIDHKLSF